MLENLLKPMEVKAMALQESQVNKESLNSPLAQEEVKLATVARASVPNPETKVHRKSRFYSVAYKVRILEEWDRCTKPEERGAILRREGLHSDRIYDWRKARRVGRLTKSPKKQSQAKSSLEKENSQLKKKLQQAQAIIDIQKKVSQLFGMSCQSLVLSEKE